MLQGFFDSQKYIEGDVKLESIQIDKPVGRGNSDVFLALLNKQKIAIKQTQIKSDYQYNNFLQEISTLKLLSAQTNCIVKYLGYFVTQSCKKQYGNKKYGYLLMERAEMSLSQLIKHRQQMKCKLTIDQIITTASTLLTGFAHLEFMKTAHCDIKPENILVISSNPFCIKICDVGSCKTINFEQQNQATIKGTLSFLAPQLIKIQTTKLTSINPFRSDVYSFGLVLLNVITGKKFTSQQRKQISEVVYFQIIHEWIKMAAQILNQQYEVSQVLKRSLESDFYKRPVFKQIKLLFYSLSKKRKAEKQYRMKNLKRYQTQNQSVDTGKSTIASQKAQITKLPLVKNSSSTTLVSFHSRQRLTQKITTKNYKNTKRSNQKPKKSDDSKKISNDKSKSRISPMQKTTMYSTFSIDKSKLSFKNENSKIIHVSSQNYSLIPYETMCQQEKIFVLYCPSIHFQYAQSVVIKNQCNPEVFDKLSHIKAANNLYLQYSGAQFYGTDENTPTIQNFESIYINLQHSLIQGGYNNLLRCLCPFSLKSLHLQLTGSQITYPEVKQELQRLKNKQVSKLDLCWDQAYLTYQNFIQINEKISKLPLKKLILSLGSAYIKPTQKSRWPLPQKCKTLYLNFPNNFLSQILGNLSSSIVQLSQLKQFYLNLENNALIDTDIKILMKALKNITNLQKAVLNFSWNQIEKGCYCFQEIRNLNKISSLQLRISKCGISFQQFSQILGFLICLFNSNLKILKLTYDRKVSKNSLLSVIEKLIKQQTNQSLKIDIIGYDYSYFMIYIKKKSVVANNAVNKGLKIKSKQQNSKNSFNQLPSNKTIQNSSNGLSKMVSHNSFNENWKCKQQEDQFGTLPLKSNNSNKIPCQKLCQATFSTYPTYECYICLGCSQNKQLAKYEYFCRACISNCEHKGHNIVRTYEKKICNCPYNQNCHFNNNQFLCAQKLGIHYKKQFGCQKCYPGKSICLACIAQCEESHPQWVQKRSSGFFQCFCGLAQKQKNASNTLTQQKIL